MELTASLRNLCDAVPLWVPHASLQCNLGIPMVCGGEMRPCLSPTHPIHTPFPRAAIHSQPAAGGLLHPLSCNHGKRRRVEVPAAATNAHLPSAAGPLSAAAADPPALQHMANISVNCPDSKGVVAALSQLLYGMNCNIVSSDQCTLEPGPGASPRFYQRLSIDYGDMLVGPGNTAVLERGIAELAQRFNMEWQVAYASKRKRVAVMVSKLDHCLYDILIRRESGELDIDVPVVISNHPDLEPVAAKFEVPFKHLPIDGKTPGSKEAQEAQVEALLQELDIDVVVLARYMQIFSQGFADRNWRRTLNIHHSSLPAFDGPRPYHRAYDRGVKIIGATAHYATADLDCGPIVFQDVTRVTHRDSVADLIRKGRDLERTVLAQALRWHCLDRVIVTNCTSKTVVFED